MSASLSSPCLNFYTVDIEYLCRQFEVRTPKASKRLIKFNRTLTFFFSPFTAQSFRVRLTGKHPFNSEAPLADLWKAGFLTPSSLFYVRNHGAVPAVSQQEATSWKLRVHGLVEKEISFSIQDLKDQFETVTIPITLVCAGNRRKEQNMVAKGLGVSRLSFLSS